MAENQLPSIPPPPAGASLEVQQWMQSVKEIIEVRNGLRGNALDQGVTFRDLVDAGIATLPNITVPASGGGGTASDVSLPITIADQSPPPALTGLTATGALSNILLGWNLPPDTSNYAYTEIWRASTNTTVANAALLDTTTAKVYANTVGASGVTYWYWIRGVSKQGQKGSFNAVAGVSAATGTINGVDLTNLIIDATKIADGAVDIGGAKVTGTITNPARFGAAVIGTAAIANAAITNALIGSLAVDTANIASGAITNAKIGSLAVDTAQINTGAITNAKIGNAAVDTLQVAGNAVTVPSSAFTGGSTTLTGSYADVQSISVTTTGQPVSISFSCAALAQFASSFQGVAYFKLFRGTTELFSVDGSGIAIAWGILSTVNESSYGAVSFSFKESPAAGTYTYKVQAYAAYGSVFLWNRFLQILEVKR